MFGDLFSQHADYEKGILYQGRRRFLVPKGKNALEPPVEFMTRRQSQRSVQNSRVDTAKLQPNNGVSDIAPPHLANVILNSKNSFLSLRNNGEFRSKRHLKDGGNKPLIIQHFSSVDAKDWEERYEAGCHIYVNKNTGEVADECPWKASVLSAVKSKQLQQSTSGKVDGQGPNAYIGSPSNRNIRLEPLAQAPSPLTKGSNAVTSPSPLKTGQSAFLTPPMARNGSVSNVLANSGASVVSVGSIGSLGGVSAGGRYQVYDEAEDLGTGSLVYDRNELEDMLSLLDSAQVADRKRMGAP